MVLQKLRVLIGYLHSCTTAAHEFPRYFPLPQNHVLPCYTSIPNGSAIHAFTNSDTLTPTQSHLFLHYARVLNPNDALSTTNGRPLGSYYDRYGFRLLPLHRFYHQDCAVAPYRSPTIIFETSTTYLKLKSPITITQHRICIPEPRALHAKSTSNLCSQCIKRTSIAYKL